MCGKNSKNTFEFVKVIREKLYVFCLLTWCRNVDVMHRCCCCCCQVPIHLHTNWDSFYMEMLMLGGLAAYLLNFLAGKNRNHKLAQSWLAAHRQLLEDNFSVIGQFTTFSSPSFVGPLCFLAGWRKRRLNKAFSFLSL